MELRQLRYFVAVADSRNFRRAAQSCRVAQPSLSQQIIKLEEELGHRLFDRLGRTVMLTEAGEALLPRARAVLAAFDEIETQVAETLEKGAGALAVGAIPTMAPYLLPPATKRFRLTHPRARVALHEALTEELIERLIEGKLDVALMSLPIENDLIEWEALAEEPLLACLNAGHPLANKTKVRLEDLRDEPAIVLHSMHCLGRQANAFCLQRQIERNTACYSTQLATIQEMIGLGLGYSLLPEMCARADRRRERAYLPLTGTGPKRAVVAAWRKGRALNRLSRDFLDEVKRILGEGG